MVRSFDANFTGSTAGFYRPEIEGKPVTETGGLGKIDGEMHGGCQELLVMEQPWRARGEAIFEPILDEIADHFEVARIKDPARRIAVTETYEHLTLEGRHNSHASRLGCALEYRLWRQRRL